MVDPDAFQAQHSSQRYRSHNKGEILAGTHQPVAIFLYYSVNGCYPKPPTPSSVPARHPATEGLISDRAEDPQTLLRDRDYLLKGFNRPAARDRSDCSEPTSYLWLNAVIDTCAHGMPPLSLHGTLAQTLETAKKRSTLS